MTERYRQAFLSFLESWLQRRNVAETLAWMADDCTGFGTGADEVAHGTPVVTREKTDAGSSGETVEALVSDRQLYIRDINDAPNPVSYEICSLSVQEISPTVGIVMAVLSIQTSILEQKVSFRNLRMSCVFSEGPDGLRLRHDHVSIPTNLHGMGEAYPIRELEERMQVFERMLRNRTQTLQQAYVSLAEIVNKDKLTGIASRHKLDEFLEAELQRLRRYGTPFSILFFDIDRFKLFNDRYGHAEGDVILQLVAEAISRHTRDTDCAGRWGGDEFLIVLPQTVGEPAGHMAERLMEDVRQIVTSSGAGVSTSMGLVAVKEEDTADSLLSRADAAMYRAKAHGGNSIVTL